ncbi:hypothetical protein [Streptomyces sp. NPDC059176]|uniref:hypothetical protein n=1 Tax=unclassified Streptomyces TaxID=2593676 RepID=UPI0036A53701
MVGLFWIDDDGCWLGAPADEFGTGMLLTDHGVATVGSLGASPQSGSSAEEAGRCDRAWSWQEVDRVTVLGVPSGPALRRSLSTAVSVAATMLGFGGPEAAPRMTVSLRQDGQECACEVSSASPAYTEREVRLSHAVLDRITAGDLLPSDLVHWWGSADHPDTPKPAAREALLEQWAAG